jgi:hypothetical protein
MQRFRIVVEVALENGHPGKWDWPELLDENNVNLVSVEAIDKMGANDPDDETNA